MGGRADIASSLVGSTVLVTGASGFVGKAVLNALLWGTEGARVLVLLRSRDEEDAHRRLVEEILRTEPFRSAPGEMVDRMLRDREIEAISGDLGAQRLLAELGEEDRTRFSFDTAAIDWTTYLEEVHLPRLREMVADSFSGAARPA
jgi:nucleoside-diphosphate-sugar epimerase